MSTSIKLISLNVECSEHLDAVLSFLEKQKPDVVCIQEIVESDIARFVATLDESEYVFAPTLRHMETQGNPIVGEAIFSRLRMVRKDIQYYVGNAADIPEIRPSKMMEEGKNNMNCVLLTTSIEKDGSMFTIGTTHFTWSQGGEATLAQRKHIRKLLGILSTYKDLVFTGDFNAPRGGEIFSMLANTYKDNVPARYTTSIDGSMHRAGPLELMVDGIFSTPSYVVSNVEMISGLSDHCALVAEVSRN